MSRLAVVVVLSVLGACADAGEDSGDAEAEAAAAQPLGKVDVASYVGLYESHLTSHKDGDLPSLELRDTDYVRARCYHASCALQLPETDRYDIYTSTSGKVYLRFWSVTITANPDGSLGGTPVVADVYELKTFSHGIVVRKSYSTRWQYLYRTSPSLACAASGGTWAANDCACPGNQPNTLPVSVFVPGAGGCIATPGSSETNCDDSGGMWTDDEGTAIQTFCICGKGRYDDTNGSCSSI